MNEVAIRLRAIEPEDLSVLYEIENDEENWGIGVTNVPYSRYLLRDYISTSSADIYVDKQLRMMIENSGGEVVGIIDLLNFDPRHRRAEVGIVIRNGFRRCGYARAALQKIMTYAHNILNLHQLHAWVAIENKSSIQLFKDEGFVVCGQLKGWLIDKENVFHDIVIMQKILSAG